MVNLSSLLRVLLFRAPFVPLFLSSNFDPFWSLCLSFEICLFKSGEPGFETCHVGNWGQWPLGEDKTKFLHKTSATAAAALKPVNLNYISLSQPKPTASWKGECFQSWSNVLVLVKIPTRGYPLSQRRAVIIFCRCSFRPLTLLCFHLLNIIFPGDFSSICCFYSFR